MLVIEFMVTVLTFRGYGTKMWKQLTSCKDRVYSDRRDSAYFSSVDARLRGAVSLSRPWSTTAAHRWTQKEAPSTMLTGGAENRRATRSSSCRQRSWNRSGHISHPHYNVETIPHCNYWVLPYCQYHGVSHLCNNLSGTQI